MKDFDLSSVSDVTKKYATRAVGSARMVVDRSSIEELEHASSVGTGGIKNELPSF